MGNNASYYNISKCVDVDTLLRESETLSTSSIITQSSPSSSLTSSPISSNKLSYFSNDNESENNNNLDYRDDANDIRSQSFLSLENDEDGEDNSNNNIGCIGYYFFPKKNKNNLIVVDKNVEATLSKLKKQQYFNSARTKRKGKSQKYVTIIEEIKKISRPRIFSSKNDSKIYIFTCEAPLSSKTINSLLRAAHLYKQTNKEVVVVLPWLENKDDQIIVYGKVMFDNIVQYEEYVQNWILSEVNMPLSKSFPIQFEFYPAKYHSDSNSIFATNDIFQSFSSSKNDICILEEPEHLNWYRSPNQTCWTQKFLYVIGIIHTNYKEYANECNNDSNDENSPYSSSSFIPATSSYYSLQTYCHTVITSPTTDDDQLNRNVDIVACNIQGVPRSLFNSEKSENLSSSSCSIYGQMNIINNYNSILKLQNAFYKMTGKYFSIDMYCDNNTIKDSRLNDNTLPIHIKESTTSSSLINNYKICVNPDRISNYSATTMNAMALNQFIILPKQNVSNMYFKSLSDNILLYKNEKEFCYHLVHAMEHDPCNYNDNEMKDELSWMAATERLIHLFS